MDQLNHIWAFCLMSFCLSPLMHAQQRAVWQSDNGDGTYTNPVIYADYSDPDVCAVGGDYYLTASSFNCVPGLPILHSRDLVNWEIIGHALPELKPNEVFDKPAHGQGVWAPSIRFHDGRFFIFWGDPDRGIFVVTAQQPQGPWTQPKSVVAGRGMIDPCPLWTDDGKCFLVNAWANSRVGFNSVLSIRELSADGLQPVSPPRIVFDGGEENHTTEGPKLYVREGYYWIFCPAGGVEQGWQLAMRSKSIYGPYEWRRVMWQGKSGVNGPHQGAWISTPLGEDWFLHFNDKGAYGRVVFLQPVDWTSGWPVMGKKGEPLLSYRKPKTEVSVSATNTDLSFRAQESDEFNNGLGLQWQWHANYNQLYGMPTSDGCYRLYTQISQGSLWHAANLLLQKVAAPQFLVTTKIQLAAKEEGQWGGLVMMGRDYSSLVVCRKGDSFVLQQRTCLQADTDGTELVKDIATLPPSKSDTIPYAPAIYLDVYLRMAVSQGLCKFSYSTDGKHYKSVGESFAMRQGKWIGAKYGFVAMCDSLKSSRGWIDVDWIRVEP